MCKKNIGFSLQVWLKHYHIWKSMRKIVLTSIEQNHSPAFKCSLKAQKYLLFIVDYTGLYLFKKTNLKQILK